MEKFPNIKPARVGETQPRVPSNYVFYQHFKNSEIQVPDYPILTRGQHLAFLGPQCAEFKNSLAICRQRGVSIISVSHFLDLIAQKKKEECDPGDVLKDEKNYFHLPVPSTPMFIQPFLEDKHMLVGTSTGELYLYHMEKISKDGGDKKAYFKMETSGPVVNVEFFHYSSKLLLVLVVCSNMTSYLLTHNSTDPESVKCSVARKFFQCSGATFYKSRVVLARENKVYLLNAKFGNDDCFFLEDVRVITYMKKLEGSMFILVCECGKKKSEEEQEEEGEKAKESEERKKEEEKSWRTRVCFLDLANRAVYWANEEEEASEAGQQKEGNKNKQPFFYASPLGGDGSGGSTIVISSNNNPRSANACQIAQISQNGVFFEDIPEASRLSLPPPVSSSMMMMSNKKDEQDQEQDEQQSSTTTTTTVIETTNYCNGCVVIRDCENVVVKSDSTTATTGGGGNKDIICDTMVVLVNSEGKLVFASCYVKVDGKNNAPAADEVIMLPPPPKKGEEVVLKEHLEQFFELRENILLSKTMEETLKGRDENENEESESENGSLKSQWESDLEKKYLLQLRFNEILDDDFIAAVHSLHLRFQLRKKAFGVLIERRAKLVERKIKEMEKLNQSVKKKSEEENPFYLPKIPFVVDPDEALRNRKNEDFFSGEPVPFTIGKKKKDGSDYSKIVSDYSKNRSKRVAGESVE